MKLQIKNVAKKILSPMLICKDFYSLLKGCRQFKKNNTTPESSYQAMIRLHAKTRGNSTKWLESHFSVRPIDSGLSLYQCVAGDLNKLDINSIVKSISQDGFYIFPKQCSEDICKKLEEFATTTPSLMEVGNGLKVKKIFNAQSPEAKIYRLDEQDCVCQDVIQDLIADPGFNEIATRYLGSSPVLNSANMWFSPSKYKEESKNIIDDAAQAYHFDMARVKWLKFFVYLTDVDSNTGPHCYVRGSHNHSVKKYKKLLERGYVRISDNDIRNVFGNENMLELTGKRGTILAVDTRGFHKGKVPLEGHRLIFELDYALSMFGGDYTKLIMPGKITDNLKQRARINPHLLNRFIPE
jgi:hypothetical protein